MLSSRTLSGLAVTAVYAFGLAASAAAPPHHARRTTPRAAHKNQADSFLPAASSSVVDVIRQVQTSPTVRRHYARYFRIPEGRVVDYLRQNLVQTRLKQAGRYTMYLVRPDGLIYPVMTTVPRGFRVFVLASGAPVLSGVDGNPIKRFSTPVETVLVPASPAPTPNGTTVKVSPSIESLTLVPVRVQETIMPTIVVTPVYRPVSPLSASEQAPDDAANAGPAEKTASKP